MARNAIQKAARTTGLVVAALIASAGTLYASGHTVKLKERLTATSAAPDARGKAQLKVQSSAKGKLNIVVTHLARDQQYDLIIGGVKVAGLQTNHGGSAHVRFKTKPGANDLLLGFDPRGSQVIVRDQTSGEDVLVADIPADDDDNPNETACCVAQDDDDEGEVECEEMTPEECTSEGGTPIGLPAGTAVACLPNPCATTPHGGVTCCINETHDDENEAECESMTTEAECAEEHGTVVQASSCDPNPCAVTPPANSSACCIPEDGDVGETECEVLSSEACTAAGGTVNAGTSCEGDPCGSGDHGGDGGGDD